MGSQTFLVTAAIALFMLNALNLNRTTVNATKQTVNQQYNIEAVNAGQDLVDEVYSKSADYEDIETDPLYDDFDDPNDPDRRRELDETPTGETLYATFDISAEQEILYGVNGKIITIKVYREVKGSIEQAVAFTVPLNKQ